MEWFGFEGTLKITLFQPPEPLPPDQLTPSPLQPGHGHCQGWRIHFLVCSGNDPSRDGCTAVTVSAVPPSPPSRGQQRWRISTDKLWGFSDAQGLESEGWLSCCCSCFQPTTQQPSTHKTFQFIILRLVLKQLPVTCINLLPINWRTRERQNPSKLNCQNCKTEAPNNPANPQVCSKLFSSPGHSKACATVPINFL